MAYVSEYGNWGNEEVLVFSENDLTQSQWGLLIELPDNDKINYVKAIIAGEDTSEWEED